jgi:hypothetical protein
VAQSQIDLVIKQKLSKLYQIGSQAFRHDREAYFFTSKKQLCPPLKQMQRSST